MDNSTYSKLPTAELIKRIASYADERALSEFLSHRKLLWLEGAWNLLPEFLWKLRQKKFRPYISTRGSNDASDEKVDLVYDRMLQKFSALKPAVGTPATDGPYCNQQYIRLSGKISESRANQPDQLQLQEEAEVGRLFRNLVIRQISYSWLEVCRIADQSYARYRWKLGANFMELKRPRWMKGHAFRKWLEQNIDHPDSNRKGEKERIQNEIYETFGFRKTVSLENMEGRKLALSITPDPVQVEEQQYLATNLYATIADEKADKLHEQRPAIRKLGKKRLRRLVLRILNDCIDTGHKDVHIAREFNLSKATFSRFAGRDWQMDNEGKDSMVVPDLWRNMAHVLSQNPYYVEPTIRLGVKGTIDTIVRKAE